MRSGPARRVTRLPQLPITALVALALAVTACGTESGSAASADGTTVAPLTTPAPVVPSTSPGGAPGEATRAPSASAPPSTASTTAVPSAATSEPAPTGTVVAVTYSGGKVTGQTGRVKVALGEQVSLQVLSDTTDEVHLHGYDNSIAATPGSPAVLTFTADIPGVFEVELEDLGVPLLSLQVG